MSRVHLEVLSLETRIWRLTRENERKTKLDPPVDDTENLA